MAAIIGVSSSETIVNTWFYQLGVRNLYAYYAFHLLSPIIRSLPHFLSLINHLPFPSFIMGLSILISPVINPMSS